MDVEEDKINIENNRYPYCIVWAAIPGLSNIFRKKGHVGICTSNGVINDFSGPYRITIDDFLFGPIPMKFMRMEKWMNEMGIEKEMWDEGIKEANEIYKKKMHNLLWQNCHHHVCKAMEIMKMKSWSKKKSSESGNLDEKGKVKGKKIGMMKLMKMIYSKGENVKGYCSKNIINETDENKENPILEKLE